MPSTSRLSGRFGDGVGHFYADDAGWPADPVALYLEPYRYCVAARWEQAMSADGGASWEVNWTYGFYPRLPSSRRAIIDARSAAHPYRQVEAVAISVDLAGLEAVDAGADHEGALAALVDRPFDLALRLPRSLVKFCVSASAIKGAKPSLRPSRISRSPPTPSVSPLMDKVGEMDLGRARLVDRDRGHPDAPARQNARLALSSFTSTSTPQPRSCRPLRHRWSTSRTSPSSSPKFLAARTGRSDRLVSARSTRGWSNGHSQR